MSDSNPDWADKEVHPNPADLGNLCDKIFLRKMQHTCPLSPDRKPTTDQSIDTTRVQLGEPMTFIEFTYRSIVEGLFTGTEMTKNNYIIKTHQHGGQPTKAKNLKHTAHPAGTH